jgi:hypothetical protein
MIKYSLAFLAILASHASAITIQMGKGLAVGVNVVTTTSTPIAGGFEIKMGTFAVQPAADATFAQVMASFREFATTTSPTSGPSSGLITAADATSKVAVSTADTAVNFNTQQIYFVIGDTASSATWSYFGVLKGQTPTATSWTFPADTTGTASVNAIASTVNAIAPVIGSEIDSASGPDSFRLVATAIPEPSATMLLLGVLGFGMRRRR